MRRREVECRQPVKERLDGLGKRSIHGGVIGERLKRQGAIGLPSDFQIRQLDAEAPINTRSASSTSCALPVNVSSRTLRNARVFRTAAVTSPVSFPATNRR